MEQHSPERGIGRGMMTIGWIIVLAIVTYIFAGWEQSQYNPNRDLVSSVSGGHIEVRLKRNRWGHYVANGTINGTDVTYLLDTGATVVAIPEKVAKQIGLPILGRGQSSTANGITEVYHTRLDTLTLGDIKMHNVRASILPNMNDDEILLGMTVLKHLELVQKGDSLIIRQ